MESAVRATSTHQRAANLPSLTLTQRHLRDLELILNGGFAPLTGFMNREEYESVVHHMRLQNGKLWPMPITFDVDKETAATINTGDEIALRDAEGLLLAILEVGDCWRPDKATEAQH